MPGIDFQAVRAQVPIADVLTMVLHYEPRVRRGAAWRGPCPLHGSRSKTSRCFAVDVRRNLFHCFRCGAGGNALDLYVAVTGLPLYEAARELCRRLGRPIPTKEAQS